MTAVFCTAIQWHYKNMPCGQMLHRKQVESPAETAIIAADLATKTSNVDLSFVDRFSGTLIITGMVADVETSLRAIMDYAERTLKFTVCEITKT